MKVRVKIMKIYIILFLLLVSFNGQTIELTSRDIIENIKDNNCDVYLKDEFYDLESMIAISFSEECGIKYLSRYFLESSNVNKSKMLKYLAGTKFTKRNFLISKYLFMLGNNLTKEFLVDVILSGCIQGVAPELYREKYELHFNDSDLILKKIIKVCGET
jgi:hypothetical protein